MKSPLLRIFSLGLALTTITFIQPSFNGRLHAQNNVSGDIAGVVSDPTGAVIPGASITIVNKDTGSKQTISSGKSGEYRATFLKPGSYLVTVALTGFQSTSTTVNVTPGQVASGDIKLAIGGNNTTVEVTEAAPLLNTENADLSTTFSQQQVQQLPNPGNDLTYIAQTAPGVVMNTQGGYGNFSAFGLPATSNTFTVNGGYENDPVPQPQQLRSLQPPPREQRRQRSHRHLQRLHRPVRRTRRNPGQ